MKNEISKRRGAPEGRIAEVRIGGVVAVVVVVGGASGLLFIEIVMLFELSAPPRP